uniref:Carboxypeptidase n=1 Tax=Oryza meridionalis TaxID=40149 RepID=A0A0E0F808_9ORYZ
MYRAAGGNTAAAAAAASPPPPPHLLSSLQPRVRECESEKLAMAAAAAGEWHLPGFDGPLPFELETGYVEVDHTAGVRLFYYFIRSERSPADDPLLWLTGGPGCSAFSGLVYEDKAESWTKRASVIFLDSPVGTGFSYAADDTGAGFRTGDTIAVRHILSFLRKWLQELHPDLLSNPLYIAGDSYSGMIVPAVALGIATSSPEPHQPSLNLKSLVTTFDTPSKIPFAHGMGLISDELYEAYKKSCSIRDNTQQQSVQCNNTLDAIDEARIISTYFVLQFSDAACVKDIYENHILEPHCTLASPHNRRIDKPFTSGGRQMLQLQDLHLSEISSECRTTRYTMSRIWANNDTVREALGIHQGTVPSWQRCNLDLPYTRDIKSSIRYHLDLTTRGYRSLIYSGDHDMGIPFIGTQAWIRSLNFSVVDELRPWFVDGQVGGVHAKAMPCYACKVGVRRSSLKMVYM